MLTKTGRQVCDNCGVDVTDDQTAVTEIEATEEDPGSVLCARCQARQAGYTEGQEQSARELLEFAVLSTVRDLGADDVRSEVDRLLETRRPFYTDGRY